VYVLHENEAWLAPFRDEFRKSGLKYEDWDLSGGRVGLLNMDKEPPHGVFYNRMSASSHTRENRFACEHTAAILSWLESHGRVVVNGSSALSLEVSKAAQYSLFKEFGVNTPSTTVAFGPDQICAAAAKMIPNGPVIMKPNRSGSGIGVRLFTASSNVDKFVRTEEFETEFVDRIAVLQEFVPAHNYWRLEFVGGSLLYALKVDTAAALLDPKKLSSSSSSSASAAAAAACFRHCPASLPVENTQDAESVDALQRFNLQFEVVGPASFIESADDKKREESRRDLVASLNNLVGQKGLAVCAVEFVETADGRTLAFDLNTNTNYNADAERRAGLKGQGTGSGAVAALLEREVWRVKKMDPTSGEERVDLRKVDPVVRFVTSNKKRVEKLSHDLFRKGLFGPQPFPALSFSSALFNDFQTRSDVGKFITFGDQFDAKPMVKPDAPEVEVCTVSVNERLTPADYDRNVFHMEIDVTGTSLENYKMGDALAVYPTNQEHLVSEFLDFYGMDPEQAVDVSAAFDLEEGKAVVTTAHRAVSQVLDLFGRPTRRFYQELYPHAKDIYEKVEIAEYTLDRKKDDFQGRVDRGVTFFSILKEFPSARPPFEELAKMVPPIKSRLYSIASSSAMHPTSVHLLVVEETWETADKEDRVGLCSNHLSWAKPGTKLMCSLTDSLMHLPKDPKDPIIMAGLGTGMAPFRAFIQAKAVLKRKGIPVGPVVLYFGSRYKSKEFLYGDELEAYEKEGVLTRLRPAFSRDQKQKIYIQHRMQEDASVLNDYLLKRRGTFYLCGPTWPAEDVRMAIEGAFVAEGGLSEEAAAAKLQELKELGQYILEVY